MTAPEPWVLAIDIGTSSCRAIVFDARGRAVQDLRAQVTYAPHTDDAGASEFNPSELLSHVSGCIDDVCRKLSARSGAVTAVGVTTFWHSMAGVDAAGQSVTPLYTWADTRSGDAVAELKQRLDPATYHARSGCALHPSYFPSRLLWLSQVDPAAYRAAHRWLSPGELLFRTLFGEAGCSISMASATGLFDQNACGWDAPTLAALSVDQDRFSPLTDVDQPQYGLAGEFASRWPALAKLPWVPAIGDGASSNVGSGCVTDTQIAINLGTSGAIRVLWPADKVDIPPELWCYRLDGRRLVMGGAFSDGGEVYAWMKRTLRLPADDVEIEHALATRPPADSGITFLPFLAGERSTGWRPHARAALAGLALATEPVDILQAAMEGVSLRFALVADVLQREFPHATEIRASGGALGASPVWAQMLCDVLGRPIELSSEAEATSRGAAIVALRAAGALQDESDAATPAARTLEPRPEAHERYRVALQRQQELYRRLFQEDRSP